MVASKFVLGSGLVAALGAAGWYQLLRRPLPQTRGTVCVEGVEAPVEIRRDRWGVPFVTASNLPDLLYGQGYCHGQDRLWQLELFRRVTAGRVAEIAGEEGLPVDRLFRTFGMHRAAQAEESGLDPELRAGLEAYCAGVNAAARARVRPFELQVAGIRFEPWRPVDILAVGKLLSYGMSGNWERELLRSDLIKHVGHEKAARLEPEYPAAGPIATHQAWGGSGMDLVGQFEQVREAIGMKSGPIGSNNWAVAGARSVTGRPLMAGDPHLPLMMPALFYQQSLRLGRRFARGICIPGVPGILMGQNNDVAWSFTNTCADIQDLFIEKIDGDRYLFEGEWLPVQAVREEIKVKGRKEPVVLDLQITHHGPIVNHVLGNGGAGAEPLALRWSTLDTSVAFPDMLRPHEPESGRELVARLGGFTTPVLNLVWADRDSIGFKMVGTIPRRRGDCPDLPKPGWTGEFEWDGTVPYDELPEIVDPDEGFVVTANNRLVGDDYPHHVSSDWFDGARAARIEALLRASEAHDLDGFQAMQSDVRSDLGLETARRLGMLRLPGAREQEAIARLTAWNGEMAVDSVATTIYQAFVYELGRAVTAAIIGDRDLAERWLGRADNGFVNHISSPWRWQSHLMALWEEGDEDLLGRPWDELVLDALRAALTWLENRYGPDPRTWRWGRAHRLHAEHALGEVSPLLSRLLDRRLEAGGGQETICQNAWEPGSPFDMAWAPVWRMVADPAEPDRSRWQLFAGQSGHPGSPHYDDLKERWSAGRMQPMAGEGPWRTLRLRPGGSGKAS